MEMPMKDKMGMEGNSPKMMMGEMCRTHSKEGDMNISHGKDSEIHKHKDMPMMEK